MTRDEVLDALNFEYKFERDTCEDYLDGCSDEEVEKMYKRVIDDKDIPAEEVEEGMAGMYSQTEAGKTLIKGYIDAHIVFEEFLDSFDEIELHTPFPRNDLDTPNVDVETNSFKAYDDNNVEALETKLHNIPKKPHDAYLMGIDLYEKDRMDYFYNCINMPEEETRTAKSLLESHLNIMRDEFKRADNLENLEYPLCKKDTATKMVEDILEQAHKQEETEAMHILEDIDLSPEENVSKKMKM